jgi:hypothetical protein
MHMQSARGGTTSTLSDTIGEPGIVYKEIPVRIVSGKKTVDAPKKRT